MRRLRRPVRLGSLRRTTPISERWGFDRGAPIDRYYIEQFLTANREHVTGDILEVKDSVYAERFGSRVTAKSILDIDPENHRATIVADLGVPGSIPPAQFDCFILTQTLQYVDDLDAAVSNAFCALRPGGVLLATVPGITRSMGADEGRPDLWSFTADGCRMLFARAFGEEAVSVTSYGNVLAAIAFLTGLAQSELKARELVDNDPRFPVIVGVRALRS
jgi:SAM-dependent methyltransferase